MCGIVGILSKTGENVVPLVESMLSCIACRGPDGATIAAAEQIVQTDSVSDLRKHPMSDSCHCVRTCKTRNCGRNVWTTAI